MKPMRRTMNPGSCRLASALAAAALLLAPSLVPAQPAGAPSEAAAPSRLQDIRPLADGVWLLPGRFERGRQPDGNSVLLLGREGFVLVDSGRHAEHTQALLAFARERGAPIRFVVNTHWHFDHLGGNALLRDNLPSLRALGSRAVQHAVQDRMPTFEADLRRLLADPGTDAITRRMVEVDLGLHARRAALAPDQIVAGPAAEHELAGRALRIGEAQGVSGGDLWVLDRASGTLMVGDFVTLPVPFFDTACAEQWRAALAQLGALPFERVVPGHGPVLGREDFGRYARAFGRLLDCAAGDTSVATCATGWIGDLGPLLPAASHGTVAPMLNHYLGTRLRVPAAEQRRFCAA